MAKNRGYWLGAAALVVAAAGSAMAATVLTRDQCAMLAPVVVQAATSQQRSVDAARDLPFLELAFGEAGQTVLQAAEDARVAFVVAGDAYVAALQDLGYQLQICGR